MLLQHSHAHEYVFSGGAVDFCEHLFRIVFELSHGGKGQFKVKRIKDLSSAFGRDKHSRLFQGIDVMRHGRAAQRETIDNGLEPDFVLRLKEKNDFLTSNIAQG